MRTRNNASEIAPASLEGVLHCTGIYYFEENRKTLNISSSFPVRMKNWPRMELAIMPLFADAHAHNWDPASLSPRSQFLGSCGHEQSCA